MPTNRLRRARRPACPPAALLSRAFTSRVIPWRNASAAPSRPYDEGAVLIWLGFGASSHRSPHLCNLLRGLLGLAVLHAAGLGQRSIRLGFIVFYAPSTLRHRPPLLVRPIPAMSRAAPCSSFLHGSGSPCLAFDGSPPKPSQGHGRHSGACRVRPQTCHVHEVAQITHCMRPTGSTITSNVARTETVHRAGTFGSLQLRRYSARSERVFLTLSVTSSTWCRRAMT